MTWLQPLREPIRLKDGRSLVRLTDIHELIVELPADRRWSDHWRVAETLVETAARDSTHANLKSLQAQLMRALAFDRMI